MSEKVPCWGKEQDAKLLAYFQELIDGGAARISNDPALIKPAWALLDHQRKYESFKSAWIRKSAAFNRQLDDKEREEQLKGKCLL